MQWQIVAHEHVEQAELAARQRVAHVAHDALERRANALAILRLEQRVAVVDGQLDKDEVGSARHHPVGDHEGENLGAAVAAECGHLLHAHATARTERLQPLGHAWPVAIALLCHAAAQVAHAQWLAPIERGALERCSQAW